MSYCIGYESVHRSVVPVWSAAVTVRLKEKLWVPGIVHKVEELPVVCVASIRTSPVPSTVIIETINGNVELDQKVAAPVPYRTDIGESIPPILGPETTSAVALALELDTRLVGVCFKQSRMSGSLLGLRKD